jgi:Domain of unknown function (DUF4365)
MLTYASRNAQTKSAVKRPLWLNVWFNHIERHILYAGNILRRYSQNDYGYDGKIDTFNEQGEALNRSFMIQLKSTDNIQLSEQHKGYIVDLSKRDLELWLDSFHPVLLVLFDAQNEIAYYTDLQTYFEKNRILLKNGRKFVRVYCSNEAIFDKPLSIICRKFINKK